MAAQGLKFRTLIQVLHRLLPSRILNPCRVEFFLPCVRWGNGFLVSVQPLHCILVCILIVFVPSLGLFSYAFFFLRKIVAKFVPFITLGIESSMIF